MVEFDLDAPVGLELLGDARVDVAVGPDHEVEAIDLALGRLAPRTARPAPKAPPDRSGRPRPAAPPRTRRRLNSHLPMRSSVMSFPLRLRHDDQAYHRPLAGCSNDRARSRPWIKRPDAGRGSGMNLLSLRSGRLGLDLAPQAGGSIARFTADGSIDLLRPMTAEADRLGPRQRCRLLSAGAVLRPHRERPLRLRRQRDSSSQPNWPGVRHPMHGDGWARPWERRAQRRPLRRASSTSTTRGEGLALPLSRPPVLPSRRRPADDRHRHREPGRPAGAGRPRPASVLRARRRYRAHLPHAGRSG